MYSVCVCTKQMQCSILENVFLFYQVFVHDALRCLVVRVLVRSVAVILAIATQCVRCLPPVVAGVASMMRVCTSPLISMYCVERVHSCVFQVL